jgi:hypothetical protein
MNRFIDVSQSLSELEEHHRGRLNESFRWTANLRQSITGSVQFGAVDGRHRSSLSPLPVVVAIGINYTQGGVESDGELVPFRSDSEPAATVRNTDSVAAVAMAVAAFNRNKDAWLNPKDTGAYRSPLGSFASDARATEGVVGEFILVMTNLCPFITRLRWQCQAKRTPEACSYLLQTWPNTPYLDDLYQALGCSVDLWIGHSAKAGTHWVWPAFLGLMRKWHCNNWLLTPNLSKTAANVHFPIQFPRSGSDLFTLFRGTGD